MYARGMMISHEEQATHSKFMCIIYLKEYTVCALLMMWLLSLAVKAQKQLRDLPQE